MADTKEQKKDTKEQKKDTKEQKKEVGYFVNRVYSGLSVATDNGDNLDPATFKSERFVPYYDTYKGDTVKIGLLKTENKRVIELCREDVNCEEIKAKEYEDMVSDLTPAPIAASV